MSLMFNNAELSAMRDVKEIFDPHNVLNPGKVFPLPSEPALSPDDNTSRGGGGAYRDRYFEGKEGVPVGAGVDEVRGGDACVAQPVPPNEVAQSVAPNEGDASVPTGREQAVGHILSPATAED